MWYAQHSSRHRAILITQTFEKHRGDKPHMVWDVAKTRWVRSEGGAKVLEPGNRSGHLLGSPCPYSLSQGGSTINKRRKL